MFRTLTALGALMLATSPAFAADFAFTSNDPLTNPFTFKAATSPNPDQSDATSFSLLGVSTNEAGPFGPLVYDADYKFYTDDAFGGFENGFVAYYSRQLFGGTAAAPIFYNGVFNLSDFSGGPTVAKLTITNGAVAPVPEPAAWALMLVGFGVIGGTLRARSRKVRVTFA